MPRHIGEMCFSRDLVVEWGAKDKLDGKLKGGSSGLGVCATKDLAGLEIEGSYFWRGLGKLSGVSCLTPLRQAVRCGLVRSGIILVMVFSLLLTAATNLTVGYFGLWVIIPSRLAPTV